MKKKIKIDIFLERDDNYTIFRPRPLLEMRLDRVAHAHSLTYKLLHRFTSSHMRTSKQFHVSVSLILRSSHFSSTNNTLVSAPADLLRIPFPPPLQNASGWQVGLWGFFKLVSRSCNKTSRMLISYTSNNARNGLQMS